MRVSLFETVQSKSPISVTNPSWPEFVVWFRACAAQVLAPLEPTLKRPEPGLCSAPLVLYSDASRGRELGDLIGGTVDAIGLDYDDAPGALFERALARAKTLGEGLAHTTWSWEGGELVRARIVLPFSKPEPIELFGSIWDTFSRVLGTDLGISITRGPGGLDGQTKNANRLWYIPCTRSTAPPWAQPCWFEAW